MGISGDPGRAVAATTAAPRGRWQVGATGALAPVSIPEARDLLRDGVEAAMTGAAFHALGDAVTGADLVDAPGAPPSPPHGRGGCIHGRSDYTFFCLDPRWGWRLVTPKGAPPRSQSRICGLRETEREGGREREREGERVPGWLSHNQLALGGGRGRDDGGHCAVVPLCPEPGRPPTERALHCVGSNRCHRTDAEGSAEALV